jgi:Asp-tRNA(Asn)/Glu-tRNA(Gln) amidotransferase A subunit family amidase
MTCRRIALEGRLFRTLLHHRAHRNRSQGDAGVGDKYGDHMQPHLVDAIKGTMTDTQITDAVIAWKKCANQAWRFFRTYDLLLTPTIACTPFKQDIQGPELIEGKKADPFQWIAFTYQFNMTGQAAATVPAGFTKDGLPIGLQIVGGQLDDATVLRAAAAYEAAAPWKDKWPPMLAQIGYNHAYQTRRGNTRAALGASTLVSLPSAGVGKDI